MAGIEVLNTGDTIPQLKGDRHVTSWCVGSGLSVLNKDTKTAQPDPDDPHQILSASAGADLNCVFIRNRSMLPWFEMYPFISGATTPATALIVRPFGYVKELDRNVRRIPADYDTTNFDESHYAAANQPNGAGVNPFDAGYFLPLIEEGQPLPAPVTFDNTVVVDKDDVTGGLKRFKILTPRIVCTVGYSGILVAIVTPHDGGITAGMLIGRYTSHP